MAWVGPSHYQTWRRIRFTAVVLPVVACARGVPKPEFVTPFNVVTPDSIRSYLDKLKFDERDGAGDEQHLIVGCPDACRLGPLVAIHPERRSHNNKNKNLATGPGRIVARLINRDQKQGYPRLNLAPGDTVYWAVDSVRSVGRSLSRGRSLYISAAGLRARRGKIVDTHPLSIDEHPGEEKVNTALARWIFDTTDYQDARAPGGGSSVTQRIWTMIAWGNCRSGGCCR
jgi:hypothetical protein